MNCLEGVTLASGGWKWQVLYPPESVRPALIMGHILKATKGLKKKPPSIAAKLVLEQFPAVTAVEIRYDTSNLVRVWRTL